jgi:hypothetical protein
MKIIILAMARTGSSSLQRKLAEKHKLKIIYEPSYDANRDLNEQIEKDSVVKIILWRMPDGVTDEMKWWLELTSKFDEVILLARKSLKDCAESISYMRYQRERTFFNGSMKYVWEPTPNYPEVYDMVNEYYLKLVELSKALDVDITYYEDIFDLNSPNRLRTTLIEKRLL